MDFGHEKSGRFGIVEVKTDKLLFFVIVVFCGLVSVQNPASGDTPAWPLFAPIPFEYKVIDDACFGHRQVGDIDGDGFNDIVAINETESHGVVLKKQIPDKLVWYEYPRWEKHTICEIAALSDYPGYSACDMEIADIDGDGDLDVIGRLAAAGGEEGMNCWFENPRPQRKPGKAAWKRHDIGKTEYVKEIETADFDRDGRLDVVTRTMKMLYVWLQKNADTWHKITIPAPGKEGTTVGDIDRDGDPDIMLAGYWVETPEDALNGIWKEHNIDRKWYTQKWHGKGNWRDNCSKVLLEDMNGDGCLDLIICSTEMYGYPISWYQAPADPRQDTWAEHIIGQMDWCHNLAVADMDNDGDIDVVGAEMPRYSALSPVIVFVNNGDSLTWKPQVIANTGNYSLQIGDIGNDGDIDIIGLRRYNLPPIELWENKTSDNKLALDKWTYIEVDNKRGKWGDFDEPKWMKYFGLAMADLNHDGYKDIASGRYVYHNPGRDMTAPWVRVDLGFNVDAMVVVDVDNDEFGDVIGQALPDVYWLEAQDRAGNSWKAVKIGELPKTDHVNTQDYGLAQIIAGGKPEVLMGARDGIYCFEIPAQPALGNWPCVRIIEDGGGYSTADIDGDGQIDIAGSFGDGGTKVAWWKNPGDKSGNWKRYEVGTTKFLADRRVLADINGDGRLDIVVTEERYPGPDPDASLYWFQQPAEPTSGNWIRHTVVTQYSLNNLDVADIDKDGDIDIIVCEHKGPKEKLQVWENNGKGKFTAHTIDRGRESHLGAQLADMDGDGDLDIVSIAWDDYRFVHLWRNDAQARAAGEQGWAEAWGDYQFMRDLRK